MSDIPKHELLPRQWLDNMPDPIHTVEDAEELERMVQEAKLKPSRLEKLRKPDSMDVSDQFTGQTVSASENVTKKLIPLDANTPEPAEATPAHKRTASEIVDITDQFIGKSLIITGARPPKKPLTSEEREEKLR
jgi:hypothetical protein